MKGDVSKGEIDTNRVRCGANQCVDKVTRKLKYEAKIVEEVSVRAALNNIMDCFTGADGGRCFGSNEIICYLLSL